MSDGPGIPFETEPTLIGEQTLIPGVRPVSTAARLQALAARPMVSDKAQRPCDLGLFDEVARNQLDLFSAPTSKPMKE
jgi:hypothetical protein